MNLTAITILCAAMLVAAAAADQVRVTVRVIEVPHAALTKWLSDPGVKGWRVHDEAVKLALAGGAEIVETNVLAVRSGEKAEMGSIAEIIFPTESEPWSLNPNQPIPKLGQAIQPRPFRRPGDYTCFEIRNTGVSLEIEPTVHPGGKMVDLRLSLDMVERTSSTMLMEFRDEWGDASVRMPVFGSKKLSGSINTVSGVFELWNVFTPEPAAIPAPATRMLVFVRADVLPIPIDP